MPVTILKNKFSITFTVQTIFISNSTCYVEKIAWNYGLHISPLACTMIVINIILLAELIWHLPLKTRSPVSMTQNIISSDAWKRLILNNWKVDKNIPVRLPVKNMGKQRKIGSFPVIHHYLYESFFFNYRYEHEKRKKSPLGHNDD